MKQSTKPYPLRRALATKVGPDACIQIDKADGAALFIQALPLAPGQFSWEGPLVRSRVCVSFGCLPGALRIV